MKIALVLKYFLVYKWNFSDEICKRTLEVSVEVWPGNCSTLAKITLFGKAVCKTICWLMEVFEEDIADLCSLYYR